MSDIYKQFVTYYLSLVLVNIELIEVAGGTVYIWVLDPNQYFNTIQDFRSVRVRTHRTKVANFLLYDIGLNFLIKSQAQIKLVLEDCGFQYIEDGIGLRLKHNAV